MGLLFDQYAENLPQTLDEKVALILGQIAEIKECLRLISNGKSVQSMYTISEACRVLGISRTTFDRYAKDGKISVTKVMGKNYVSQAAINSYLGG